MTSIPKSQMTPMQELMDKQAIIEVIYTYTESYWLVYLRASGNEGMIDIIGGGRYVDRFEKFDGIWKIRHRQCIFDWDRVDKVTPHFGDAAVIKPNNPENATMRGLRDRSDYSYKAGLSTKVL